MQGSGFRKGSWTVWASKLYGSLGRAYERPCDQNPDPMIPRISSEVADSRDRGPASEKTFPSRRSSLFSTQNYHRYSVCGTLNAKVVCQGQSERQVHC